MLIRTLYFEPASITAAVVCSLIVAGLLKGIIGVGMPVVALPLLSLFIDIKSAAMLLSMPLIFSNLPQALEGGKTGRCLMQLMPVILGMIPGLFLGVRVLLALDANVAKVIAGLVLMGVGGVTLLVPKLQLQSRLVLPTASHSDFSAGFWEASQRCRDRLFSYFCLQRDCAERRSQRKHRCISSFPPACWQFF
jgi:uncharacterized membrane protein YfcA